MNFAFFHAKMLTKHLVFEMEKVESKELEKTQEESTSIESKNIDQKLGDETLTKRTESILDNHVKSQKESETHPEEKPTISKQLSSSIPNTTIVPSTFASVVASIPRQWVQYFDPTSKLPYYYDLVSQTTQWEKPSDFVEIPIISTPSSVSSLTTSWNYGSPSVVDFLRQQSQTTQTQQQTYPSTQYGTAYQTPSQTPQEPQAYTACFNSATGRFSGATENSDWESVNRPVERDKRQMHAFFDTSQLDANRQEAKEKQKELRKAGIDWKKYKEEQKKKKVKRQTEWMKAIYD